MKTPGESSAADRGLSRRHRKAKIAKTAFLAALCFAILSLATLLCSILDQTSGYMLTTWETDPATVLAEGESVESLSAERLRTLLGENLSARRVKALEAQKPLAQRDQGELAGIFENEVLGVEIVKTWPMTASLLNKTAIAKESERLASDADATSYTLSWRFWLSTRFLTSGQSGDALLTGCRTAVLGSFLTILLTILIAFPLGIGAAIWLEEYAGDNALTRFIQTNIYNLAGVPSIIYGMLGLAIFVRGMFPVTSGAIFGAGDDGNGGRTILSASLTLAILILPILIINAQEALKAVPRSLRESGWALGATRWQVISAHILPSSMDRILTGTVIAISRALGETAPLVIIGAATYLTKDPSSIFSRFTTLPIQIYQWTARPQAEFRNVAAAAIVALVVLLLSLNAGAIILRDRYRSAKR